MGVYLVGLVKIMKKVVAVDFAADTGEIKQMKPVDAYSFINTNKVENASIVGGQIVSIPNDLGRYSDYKPTVLKRIVGVRRGYKMHVYGSGVCIVNEIDAYDIIKKEGATNAKAVERGGRKTVSALVGNFQELHFNPKTDTDYKGSRGISRIKKLEEDLQTLVPDMEDHYALTREKYLVTTFRGNTLTYLVDFETKKVREHIKSKEEGSSCVRYILGVNNIMSTVYIVMLNAYANGYSELMMLRVDENGITKTLHTSKKFKHEHPESSVGMGELDISYEGDFFIPILGDKGFNVGYYYGNPTLNKYYMVEWGDIKGLPENMDYFNELDATYHNDNGLSTDIKAVVEPCGSRDSDIFKLELRVRVMAVRYRRSGNGEREELWEIEVDDKTAFEYKLVEDGVITKDILNCTHRKIINMGGYKEPEFVVYGRKSLEKYYFVYGVKAGLMERILYIQRLRDTKTVGLRPHQLKEHIDDGTLVNLKIENGKAATTVGNIKDYFVKPNIIVNEHAEKRADRYDESYAPESSVMLLGRASWDSDLYITSSYYASHIMIQALTESQLLDKLTKLGKNPKHNISNFRNVNGRLEFTGTLEVITKRDLAGVNVHDAEYMCTSY